jgi:hypothetical protein
MKATRRPETLKRLLDVADRLERLRRRLEGRGESSDEPAARDLRDEGRRWVRDLLEASGTPGTADAPASDPVPGILGRLHRRFKFDEDQTTILLLLLRRRIEGDRESLSGREILSFLYEDSYERLRGLRLLAPSGVLRRSGVVESRGGSGDPFDSQHSLSPRVFRSLQREVAPELRGEARWHATPYRGAREHLTDWGRLARYYQRRARMVFDAEDPTAVANGPDVRRLDARIARDRLRITRRLSLTPGAAGFPLVGFVDDHGLNEKEALVVVAMLFQDVYAGASFIDGIEIVKLVSSGEEELIANRRMLDPSARLLRDGILRFADGESGDEPRLAREAFLDPDVVDELLAGTAPHRPIDANTRLAWHEFLESLDDSDDFELGDG